MIAILALLATLALAASAARPGRRAFTARDQRYPSEAIRIELRAGEQRGEGCSAEP
jgi:hypothetical protein